MTYNLNQAEKQRPVGLVPPGIYRLRARIRPGNAGENDLLRLAKNMRTMMVDFEHTVIGGEHAGHRVWDLCTVSVDLRDDDFESVDPEQARKYRVAVDIGLTKLRAILESAHGIDPDDKSEEAQRIRQFESVRVFDGLEFLAYVEIKPGENSFPDRNVVQYIITPDSKGWSQGSAPKPSLREALNEEIPF